MLTEERPSLRPPVFGARAMVVSGHSAATLAGVEVLRRGGNIVDAMVAASAALTAVVGQATSIGGDCFVLFHEARTGRTIGLNASGTAPAAATPGRFAGGMPTKGPLASVVPGIVRAWEAMHSRFGRSPWGKLFEPAIDLAEASPVSFVLATRAPGARRDLANDPGCAALYLPGGQPLAVGDTLRQPALATTLRAIARDGADAFYVGEIARRTSDFLARQGGLITASDLASFRPLWVEPVSADYRGHRVSVMPPNSCGVLLLMQLNGLSALESSDLIADPSRRAGYQMSAMKVAFESGARTIADPSSAPDTVARLLSPDMTARMRDAVSRVAEDSLVPNHGGTACLLLADAEGNAISMVQSVYNVFGSCCLDPQTGILFNNRMQDFTHRPNEANSVGPGRRPAHTLCPVLVHRDERVRYVLASPGGISQTLTNVQLLNHLIDGHIDVGAAVEAPRWCNRRTGDFLIEPGFAPDAVETLRAMGHTVKVADDPYFYGSAKAIERMPSGNLAGAGDHRREAFALGL